MTKEIIKSSYNAIVSNCDTTSHREDIGCGALITTHYLGVNAGKKAAEDLLTMVEELKMNVRVLMASKAMVVEYRGENGDTLGILAGFEIGEYKVVNYTISFASVDGSRLTFVDMNVMGDVGMLS